MCFVSTTTDSPQEIVPEPVPALGHSTALYVLHVTCKSQESNGTGSHSTPRNGLLMRWFAAADAVH
jgi:hypothetical protein